jgi:hypothetical protein
MCCNAAPKKRAALAALFRLRAIVQELERIDQRDGCLRIGLLFANRHFRNVAGLERDFCSDLTNDIGLKSQLEKADRQLFSDI